MENKNNNNHNGFGNGFVLGLLVGIVATLFITTKKGREIFKEITEKGMDKYADLEQKIQETTERFEKFDDEDDYLEPEPVKASPTPIREVHPAAIREAKKEHHHEKHDESSHKPHPVRRFFKGKKN